MSEFLPKDVRRDLALAQKAEAKRKSRYRVKIGDETFTILRHWHDGFSLDARDAPHLRGNVDVYDGGRHLQHCLIVASSEDDGEMIYEFKRATSVSDRPALDYARDDDAPVALIGE